MNIKHLKENERKIGGWMKLLGDYIEAEKLHLTDNQLESAASLIIDIYSKFQKEQEEIEK